MAAEAVGRLLSRVRRSVPGFDRPTSKADAAYRTVAISIVGFAGAGLFSVYRSGFGQAVVMGFFCVFVLGPLAFLRRVWFVTPGTVSAVLGFVAIRNFQESREAVALGSLLVALSWTAVAAALAVRSVDASAAESTASPE